MALQSNGFPGGRCFRFAALAIAVAFATGCGERDHAGEAGPAGTRHTVTVAPVVTATDAHDTHDQQSTGDPVLPAVPVTPWQGDAPLREGMRRVHRAIDALGHAEHGHLDAAQVTAAAGAVQAAVDGMFANCKLDPEPDAALHGLLAVLIRGASDLREDPADLAPLAGMREALALYPRLFVDPQWQADTAPPA